VELELDFTECGIRKAPILKSKMLRTLVASLYFFLRRGQSVEVWLMTRTGQAVPASMFDFKPPPGTEVTTPLGQ
jgi:uncharacterized membrane protein